MGIAMQHPQFPMPADGTDLGNTQALLEQPRHRLMAQVVEAQTLNANPRHQALPRLQDGGGGRVEYAFARCDPRLSPISSSVARTESGTSRLNPFLVCGR